MTLPEAVTAAKAEPLEYTSDSGSSNNNKLGQSPPAHVAPQHTNDSSSIFSCAVNASLVAYTARILSFTRSTPSQPVPPQHSTVPSDCNATAASSVDTIAS